MTEGIKDKVVVISGASSGLGEAAARHLAQHGATAQDLELARAISRNPTARSGRYHKTTGCSLRS
jgi:NAD(P)-dependent dehydrogenase (short-subunit alcohol dehydrogenase family)